jgi:hypothetical protein
MPDQDWTVKEMIKALTESPPDANAYYEMPPNGPGPIGNTQYVKLRGADDEMRMLLDR